MHPNEQPIDADLVRRLLAAQFPAWASQPLERVRHAGTDNAIYRLGPDMAVRLPRIREAAGQVDKEQAWLPRLAPSLPLEIPTPLGLGEPGEGYPFRWSVYRWIAGGPARSDRVADLGDAAAVLAGFVRALHAIDTSGGPAPGQHNFFRGVPLAEREGWMHRAIAALPARFDRDAITRSWEDALDARRWDRAPVWIHGDLQPGNLLAVDGRIRAVIDFGGLGVGDPACDLIVAWNLLDAGSRATFREVLGADDATWERGCGWALSAAVIGIPYYLESNPSFVRDAEHTLGEVLADRELTR